MTITPAAVREQRFHLAGIARRGYDEGEVDDFLDRVASALAERDDELEDLRARGSAGAPLPAAAAPVAPEDEVGAVSDLLAMAQRTAREHVATAEARAAEVLAGAEDEAQRVIGTARAEADRVLAEAQARRHQELEVLRRERQEAAEAVTALRAATERARSHLEAYLADALAQVRRPAVPEQAGHGDAPRSGAVA